MVKFCIWVVADRAIIFIAEQFCLSFGNMDIIIIQYTFSILSWLAFLKLMSGVNFLIFIWCWRYLRIFWTVIRNGPISIVEILAFNNSNFSRRAFIAHLLKFDWSTLLSHLYRNQRPYNLSRSFDLAELCVAKETEFLEEIFKRLPILILISY